MSHDPLPFYCLHALTYTEEGLPVTKLLVPAERRGWLIILTHRQFYLFGELVHLASCLPRALTNPINHTLDMKNKSLLPLSFSSFLTLIYPRLALNVPRPEWPWIKIKWPVFLPLPPECKDYGHTTVAGVRSVEDRIQVVVHARQAFFQLSLIPRPSTSWLYVQCLKFLFVLGQVLLWLALPHPEFTVDQVDLELRQVWPNLSAFCVLGLKECAITTRPNIFFVGLSIQK